MDIWTSFKAEKMIIDVALTPAFDREKIIGAVVVVIDTLRASTTIATALASGARAVIPVREIDEAFAIRASIVPEALLGGERKSVNIEGFDLGNSPLEYTPERVAGKTVVMTTTNGTRALRVAENAELILCGSTINADAVAGAIAASGLPHCVLICAGTEGRIAFEDALGAGAIANAVAEQATTDFRDGARLCRDAFLHNRSTLTAAMLSTDHGKTLSAVGFADDVRYCARLSELRVVPTFREGRLVDGQVSLT